MDYHDSKRIERAELETKYIKNLFKWLKLLLVIFGVTVLAAAWGIRATETVHIVLGYISAAFAVLSGLFAGLVTLGIHRGKKHILNLLNP